MFRPGRLPPLAVFRLPPLAVFHIGVRSAAQAPVDASPDIIIGPLTRRTEPLRGRRGVTQVNPRVAMMPSGLDPMPDPARAGSTARHDVSTAALPGIATESVRRQGWFYRAIARKPQSRVLAVNAPFLTRWFADVVNGDLASAKPSDVDFGLVVLHASLGGRPSLFQALHAARERLGHGGLVAVAGMNALRALPADSNRRCIPCATAWGYRYALYRAGFVDVKLFIARPDLDDPDCIVAMSRGSSLPFFRFELAARRATGRLRVSPMRAALADLGLAAWLEPFVIAVGKKC